MRSHHTAILGLAICLGAGLPTTGLPAEPAFPSRPVTIVVPYSAGGGTDALARNIARVWQQQWKTPVLVVNRTGADGIIGTEYVRNQPADGYTVLMQVNQALFYPYTLPSANIDILKDFKMVSKLQQNAMVFGVAKDSPDQTFPDLIKRCRTARTPCSFGAATRHGEIMARQIAEKSQLGNAIVANYKGTAPMMTDALGGHITLGMPSLVVALPQVRGGSFRALATGSNTRLPELPDVPTLNELGLQMSAVTWYGLMVRQGTPENVVAAIGAGIQAAAHDRKVRESMRSEGAIPVFSDAATFDREAREEARAVEPLLEKYLTSTEKGN
ncbi:lipoprotein [Bordetella ansorpii]|uniref:Lipoprotein n=1 Tax=Bordetella ansorpii TaxID=288768 RepID=A0A157PPD7_9BORD|nr:tripartite tricarboxylate transporter substrate binding protein [Bordetella ansorpii]SAI34739.1 lipoprotein [Bordetella ansorpii]